MPTCGTPPGLSGASRGHLSRLTSTGGTTARPDQAKGLVVTGFLMEPPWGIEPQTYALREARETAPGTLPAQIAALTSRNALCAQSARIPEPRPGPRPGQPPITECYQRGPGSPNKGRQ